MNISSGTIYTVKEIHTSLKPTGISIRTTAKLVAYDANTSELTLEDNGYRIYAIYPTPFEFKMNDLYQVIGEYNREHTIQARIVRNVQGLHLDKYHQALALQRSFLQT